MKGTRIYVSRKSATHDAIALFLRLYGIPTNLQTDAKGTYFDVTPPKHWIPYRLERFSEGLAEFGKKV
jgi:hypothetical protein